MLDVVRRRMRIEEERNAHLSHRVPRKRSVTRDDKSNPRAAGAPPARSHKVNGAHR